MVLMLWSAAAQITISEIWTVTGETRRGWCVFTHCCRCSRTTGLRSPVTCGAAAAAADTRRHWSGRRAPAASWRYTTRSWSALTPADAPSPSSPRHDLPWARTREGTLYIRIKATLNKAKKKLQTKKYKNILITYFQFQAECILMKTGRQWSENNVKMQVIHR